MCLQDKWSAVYSVQTILLSLQSLLGGESCTYTFPGLGLTRQYRAQQRVSPQPRRCSHLGYSRRSVILEIHCLFR